MNHLFQQYHHLTDKRLNGTLSEPDERELGRIEQKIQLFEDTEISEIEKNIERRHRRMMQQISELTDELRQFASGGCRSI